MSKLIFILLDGLRFDVAQASMGFLAHLIEIGQASFYKVQAELPSVSRPIYEVLMTGTPSSINGITSNNIVRRSHQVSIFDLARQQNLTTAAVGYYFFSELYNRAPFNRITDRSQDDEQQLIQHGRFHWDDRYPDSHIFADAEALRRSHNPDFLLVHPCEIDTIGHRCGGESPEYRTQAVAMDDLLAQYVPIWRSAGYEVLITADHGMNADGQHGGISIAEREVPLFCLSSHFEPGTHFEGLSQLAIAPLICQMLSLPLSEKMRSISVPGFRKSFVEV